MYLPGIATLAGSAIGGLTSLAWAWVSQSRHDLAEHFEQDKSRRQELYKRFIDEASKLYADALLRNQAHVAGLVGVYALISQMRVLSSASVIEEAEEVVQTIVETYLAPNGTFPVSPNMVNYDPTYPLHAFSEKCRAELSNLRPQLAIGAWNKLWKR
jgi:hypothetical protein